MSDTMTTPHSATPGAIPGRRLALLAALAAGVALGACTRHKTADVTASIPTDYRDRHPIVLSEAPRSIEIYANGPRLDQRQADDLAAFAAEYRAHGRSRIIAEAPSGGGHALHHVRAKLAQHGIAGSLIETRSYPAGDYTAASPVKLSFAKLQARVPHACGMGRDDLGASNYRFGASNNPHWNLGCAYQTNIAQSAADPLDLVRARQEDRSDSTKRLVGIGKLRQGQDPSTQYRDQATTINRAVGN
jgi:pilus assembly protein CpaD